MRIHFLAITLYFSLSSTLISARFFPNISSIPPRLISNGSAAAWDSFQKFSGSRPGQKTDGLSKLKRYFQDFGYIPDSQAGNFTDNFDDALEQAIRTYQQNFNLNPTGQLDDETLKLIQQPRCGNADIVNGSTTMNSGKPKSYMHTVRHYSFFPGTPRWPANKRDLTYGFLPDNQLSDTVKEVFSRSFARWSTVTTLTFTEVTNYVTADIRIGFFTGDHGDGEPFDGILGTLAHAFSPPNGRFHLDGDENWVVSGDVTTSTMSTAIDLESVAVHEIGHLLGLGHSSVGEAIMFPTISAGTRKVELASDDIQGIEVLYGSNPNYNGTSASPAAQDRNTNDNSMGHVFGPFCFKWAFMAVGFLFLIF